MENNIHDKTYGGNAAENYEKYFVPSIGRPIAIELMEIADLRADDRILDVACGTGIVARLAATQVGNKSKIAGLDLNPSMLAVAKSVSPPQIEWHEGSAEAMPFSDAVYDVVLCQFGLMFMQNKSAALREMRRVLVSGGRLILDVPGLTPTLFTILQEALAKCVTPEAAEFLSTVFSMHDPRHIQDLLRNERFQNIKVRQITKKIRLPHPKEFLWDYLYSTPLIGVITDLADERKLAIEDEVVSKWQKFVNEEAMLYDQGVLIVTAKK
jgi:ubiquinone/menaquinone biosynthesis C-methylase UbiE